MDEQEPLYASLEHQVCHMSRMVSGFNARSFNSHRSELTTQGYVLRAQEASSALCMRQEGNEANLGAQIVAHSIAFSAIHPPPRTFELFRSFCLFVFCSKPDFLN
jgi:hypothetical protein